MRNIGLLMVVLLCILPGTASASFPEQQSAEEYFDASDYVAYVLVESGKIHRIDGEECGVRYEVSVLTQLKGDLPSHITIANGPSISPEEVGRRYLIFLSTTVGHDRRKLVQYLGMPEEFLSKCRTDEVYLQPTILIGEALDGTTHSFLIPTRVVDFPDGMTSSTEVDAIGTMSILEPAYVPRDKVLKYLEDLAKAQNDPR